MSKTTLTNTLPLTLIAVVGDDSDPQSKEITFIESFSFDLSWTMYAALLDSDISVQELSIRQNQTKKNQIV